MYTGYHAVRFSVCIALILFVSSALSLPFQTSPTEPLHHLSSRSDVNSTQAASQRAGWVSAPNERGTIDILWTALFTMFLCSWSILCPNVPAPEKRIWTVHRKIWLTFLCFMGPEFILQVALGQWVSAKKSVEDFKAAGFEGWTMRHAFYADMGGLQLGTAPGQQFPAVRPFPTIPITAAQYLRLIQLNIVHEPTPVAAELGSVQKTAARLGLFKEDLKQLELQIEDRNKVDGMLRFLTVCQAGWFGVNIIGRAAQRLPVTCIELTAAGFILCSLPTLFFWREKPADVYTTTIISSRFTMEEIMQRLIQDEQVHSKDRSHQLHPSTLWHRTPLEIIDRKEWTWSIYWSHWINILRLMRINFAPKKLPVDRYETTFALRIPTRTHVTGWCFLAIPYLSFFLIGWNFEFPTMIEQLLWRISACGIIGCALCYIVINFCVFDAEKLIRKMLGMEEVDQTRKAPTRRCRRSRLQKFADSWRNNSIGKDPALDVPLKAIIPVNILGFIYCMCRGYVLIADVIELRSLPIETYMAVDWTNFLPHVG